MRKTMCGVIAWLCLSSGAALAEPRVHEESGLQFELPSGWTYEKDGDTLVALSPDKKVEVTFLMLEAQGTENASAVITEELERFIKEPVVPQRLTTRKVNNLTQIYAKGAGLCENKPCDWDVALVVGAKKGLLVMATGELKKSQAPIARLYKSIQPVK